MATTTHCKYFALGRCRRGDQCNFRHDAVLPIEKRPPCIFFQKGLCRNGDACTYRHDLDALLNGRSLLEKNAAQVESEVTRTLNGVQATFGPGASVKDVQIMEPKEEHINLRVPRLVLSWKKPGKALHIGFDQVDFAHLAADWLRAHPMLHGSKSFVTLKGETRRECRQSRHTLTLRRVPTNFGDSDADHHLVRRVKELYSGHEDVLEDEESVMRLIHGALEQKLAEFGEIVDLRIDYPDMGLRCFAKVQYASMGAIRNVQADDLAPNLQPWLHVIFNERYIYSTRQIVRAPIMAALAEPYEDIVEDARAFNVNIQEGRLDRVRGAFHLRLSSEDREELGRTKQALQRLFAGTVVMAEGKILWHSAFATPSELEKINEIGYSSGTFIYRDLEAQCLRIYGPADGCSQALAALLGRLEEVHDHRKELIIKAIEFPNDYNTIVNYLLQEFGSGSVQMEYTTSTRQIKFTAFAEEINATKAYLLRFDRRIPLTETSACPICWGTVDNPVLLPCSHVYCKDCLISQLGSGQYPIYCHGAVPHGEGANTGACGQPIALDIIRRNFEYGEAFEQMLRRALLAHLKKHPSQYRACPTPDCMHWYEPVSDTTHDRSIVQFEDDDTVTFLCPSCFSSTCRVCALPAHPDSSCEEAVELYRNMDRAFDKWKRRNRVQDCPSCQMPIQKVGGCNHVTCSGCNTHICWFCMETFEDPEMVYTHMQDVHDDGTGIGAGDDDDSSTTGSVEDDEDEESETEDEEDINSLLDDAMDYDSDMMDDVPESWDQGSDEDMDEDDDSENGLD